MLKTAIMSVFIILFFLAIQLIFNVGFIFCPFVIIFCLYYLFVWIVYGNYELTRLLNLYLRDYSLYVKNNKVSVKIKHPYKVKRELSGRTVVDYNKKLLNGEIKKEVYQILEHIIGEKL